MQMVYPDSYPDSFSFPEPIRKAFRIAIRIAFRIAFRMNIRIRSYLRAFRIGIQRPIQFKHGLSQRGGYQATWQAMGTANDRLHMKQQHNQHHQRHPPAATIAAAAGGARARISRCKDSGGSYRATWQAMGTANDRLHMKQQHNQHHQQHPPAATAAAAAGAARARIRRCKNSRASCCFGGHREYRDCIVCRPTCMGDCGDCCLQQIKTRRSCVTASPYAGRLALDSPCAQLLASKMQCEMAERSSSAVRRVHAQMCSAGSMSMRRRSGPTRSMVRCREKKTCRRWGCTSYLMTSGSLTRFFLYENNTIMKST